MEKEIPLTKEQKQAKQASELKTLQTEQIAVANGEKEPETIPGNRKKNYRVLVVEKDYVHVETLVKHINPDEKSFTDERAIHKLYPREFDRRVAEGFFKPFDEVEVLHDPRKDAPSAYNLKGDEPKRGNAPAPAANIALKERELAAKEEAVDKLGQELLRKNQEAEDLLAKLRAQAEEKAAPASETKGEVSETKTAAPETKAPKAAK